MFFCRSHYSAKYLLFFLTFAACKPLNFSAKKEDLNPVMKQKVVVAKSPYHESRQLKNDLLHTKLDVSFDWGKQYLYGTATLTFKPYYYPQNTLQLDAKGFDIHTVKLINGKEQKDLKYLYDNKVLSITLDTLYSRKDTFTVEINYTAKPNELPVGGSAAIKEDKGLYFIDPAQSDSIKPTEIWTQGETEANSKWFPTIDSPNERTTQEMYITVDTGYTVLTNGEFIYRLNNGNGTKTEYWRMDLPHAPYLFMMAIGKYAVVKDTWRGKEVNYYVEPEFKNYARGIFGNTPEMLSFFSDKLKMEYPWNKYSQVVVRDYVSGAMENTTATVFMQALQIDDREQEDVNWDYIIAHELFHHWFGDLVTCESWSNIPLNEGFANYAEYLWIEHKYGKEEADLHSEEALNQYFEEAETKQVPLIRYHYLKKEDLFDRHTYNKGGRVLHLLRNYVGDDAFFDALHLYLEKNKFKSVELANLRLAFEEVTGEDLNWFFNEWFLKPGDPELKVSATYAHGVETIEVAQIQDTTIAPIYRLPTKVSVWVNGKEKKYDFDIRKKKETLTIPVSGKPSLVVFDSDFILPVKIEQKKPKEALIYQFRNIDEYLGRKQALEQLTSVDSLVNGINLKLQDTAIQQVLKEALSDEFWGIRDFALGVLLKYRIENPEYYVATIAELAREDKKTDVRANAIYFLSRYFGSRYANIFKAGLEEKSYAVAAASLSSYLKTGDSSVVVNLETYESLPNLDIQIAVANYYLSTGNKDKYAWFKKVMVNSEGVPKAQYNFLFFFGAYLTQLPDSLKNDGIEVLKNISKTSKYDLIKNLALSYLGRINNTDEKK